MSDHIDRLAKLAKTQPARNSLASVEAFWARIRGRPLTDEEKAEIRAAHRRGPMTAEEFWKKIKEGL